MTILDLRFFVCTVIFYDAVMDYDFFFLILILIKNISHFTSHILQKNLDS
jgi:hypothetical protein